MSASVRIPTPLRTVTGGVAEVKADGGTVREIIDDLDRQHPGIRERLCDEDGAIRRFVNVFVGDEDIRFMDGIETAVPEGAQISVIPAVAGGR